MRYFGMLLLLGGGLLLGGCNDTPTVVDLPGPSPSIQPLGKADIGPAGTLVSAHLEIYVPGIEVPSQVNVHRVTAPWSECGATWLALSSAFDPDPAAQFTPSAIGYVSLDVTALVAGWRNGTFPNYGVIFRQEMVTDNHNTEYWSSENATFRPRLVLVININGTDQTVVIERGVLGEVADTWIWSLLPGFSGCTEAKMFTRANSVYRKEVLVRFELSSGCTRTPGYWKTHSVFGPAGSDPTWAQLPSGASTIFFLSGKTYYAVLWTPPQGNAYYILAHAYIATKLNLLNGTASTPEVNAAMAWATTFFGANTPTTILSRRGRAAAISFAGILDGYNNGLTGPGHCGD